MSIEYRCIFCRWIMPRHNLGGLRPLFFFQTWCFTVTSWTLSFHSYSFKFEVPWPLLLRASSFATSTSSSFKASLLVRFLSSLRLRHFFLSAWFGGFCFFEFKAPPLLFLRALRLRGFYFFELKASPLLFPLALRQIREIEAY